MRCAGEDPRHQFSGPCGLRPVDEPRIVAGDVVPAQDIRLGTAALRVPDGIGKRDLAERVCPDQLRPDDCMDALFILVFDPEQAEKVLDLNFFDADLIFASVFADQPCFLFDSGTGRQFVFAFVIQTGDRRKG